MWKKMSVQEKSEIKAARKKRWKIILLSIIVVLISVRLFFPYIVLKYVNKTLGEIKDYYGHVEDIDIALIRGAYKINDIKLVKRDSVTKVKDTMTFFSAKVIDLSVEWSALFKGKIVGEIYVENPVLNFIKGKHKDEDTKADTSDFKDVIKKLMPLTINHFEINNGQIHFKDPYSAPTVDVPITDIHVKADNLSNANDSNKVLPSSIVATGNLYGGTLKLNVKLDALAKKPAFDLNAGIENVEMVALNPFFKAHANFEVEKGSFGMYTEFAAKDGAFKGYVKPLLKDLKVANEGDLGEIVWSKVISAAAWVFKNHSKDQVATKLPVEGKFDQPDTGLWTAISYVLKNAFISALTPSVENTIDIGKVGAQPEKKTFLQKVFGKDDKKDKKTKSKK